MFILLPAIITEAVLAYGVSTQGGWCVPSSILSFVGIMTHLPSAFLLQHMNVLDWWWITVPLQTAIWSCFFGVCYLVFFRSKKHDVG
jgi:hypothetical protein